MLCELTNTSALELYMKKRNYEKLQTLELE